MAPWRPLGADLAPGGSPEAFGEALGRLLGPSWRLLGRSWGLLGRSWGSFWLPRGLFLELFGPPGGHFRGSFCNRGLQREKMTKTLIFNLSGKLFWLGFCVAFFVLLAAPARERTLKNQQMAWRVLHYSHVGRLRVERKRGRRMMKNGENTA